MLKRNRYLVAASLCILLPLLESLGYGTLWGLNYESPRAMDTLGDVIRLIKLLSVIAGFYLLAKCYDKIADAFHSKILKITFFSVFYILSTAQILLLLPGNVVFGIMAPKDYIHYEQNMNQESFYIYTFDPGPMSRAYHYVYLKCALPFNRYELKEIGRTDWIGHFNLARENDTLVLSPGSSSVTDEVYRLPLDGVTCKD